MNREQAGRVAERIADAYATLQEDFLGLTRRGAEHFRRCAWRDGQRDARLRLLVYPRMVRRTVQEVHDLIDQTEPDPALGRAMKDVYAREIDGRADAELAETFFNSVVRRVFGTVGIDPAMEFTRADGGAEGRAVVPCPVSRHAAGAASPGLIEDLLRSTIGDGFRDLEGDARAAAAALRQQLGDRPITAVEMLPHPFYRNKAAYLVGRVLRGKEVVAPLVLPVLNTPQGMELDAVLTTSDEASVVFGFTRSYFHVETRSPRAVVDFLASLMPLKRRDELYTAIGYHKHGKRELYAALMDHLESPEAVFQPAEGQRGMVMAVFTLPAFNAVFKVIRDVFGPSKQTSRREVIRKYHLVFVHDRVGRLADAQEFEHLEIGREHFAPELLHELLDEAGQTVHLRDDTVVIGHLYTERRVRPLDLFLQEVDEPTAVGAVIDYGNAVKDLAAANIFPGDMLLKNFGVTRHGRVVFYDYDELCMLTECRFRPIPQPRDAVEEMSAEPWFHVGPNDVFPEEFRPFLVPRGPLRDAFMEHHSDLLDPECWRAMQRRQEAGEVVDFFPYPHERRLRHEASGDSE